MIIKTDLIFTIAYEKNFTCSYKLITLSGLILALEVYAKLLFREYAYKAGFNSLHFLDIKRRIHSKIPLKYFEVLK